MQINKCICLTDLCNLCHFLVITIYNTENKTGNYADDNIQTHHIAWKYRNMKIQKTTDTVQHFSNQQIFWEKIDFDQPFLGIKNIMDTKLYGPKFFFGN